MSLSIGASISFHLTEEPFVLCHGYGTKRSPILAVQDKHASLALCARDGLSPTEQLKFARELLSAAEQYVAAVETYTAALGTAQLA
ncbi:hypothetical protein OHA19_21515 [Streptomyces sp. NBC_00012]|uniref:hypothetical protein n=1 Tax=Streptomyces sp. NBC_00012 TaxID=2975621 RepID=UPI0032472D87